MTTDELREAIDIELEAMQVIVNELGAIQLDLKRREPTLREKTAAAAFLAQFYNGVENILKRISLFCSISLPTSETWHVDLFKLFSEPNNSDLSLLLDDELALALSPYRRFRHVAFHSYGFEIDWDRMAEGVEQVGTIFERFKANLSDYLKTIDNKSNGP